MRAAEHIAYDTAPDSGIAEGFADIAAGEAAELLRHMDKALNIPGHMTLREQRHEVGALMSACAGHMRDIEGMTVLEGKIKEALDNFFERVSLEGTHELPDLLKNRDILITQLAVLSAMRHAAGHTGSRGSALVLSEGGNPLLKGIKYAPNIPLETNQLMVTQKTPEGFISTFGPVRPIPCSEQWFERIWSGYRRRTERNFER